MDKMKTKIVSLLLTKRMKSLYWSTGMMALAYFLNELSLAVVDWGLSSELTVFLGLVFAQISKALNTTKN